jgi:anti-anti-sigma factor
LEPAIHLVRLDGALDASRYPELRASLQAVPPGAGPIIVDMQRVTVSDSTALAELLIAMRRWERDGRKVATVVNNSSLRRTLVIGQLFEKLHVVETIDEALARLRSRTD